MAGTTLLPGGSRFVHRWAGPTFMQETRWSLIARVQRGERDRAGLVGRRDPADELCELYAQPMYNHLRRSGLGSEEAEDCVQSFWAKLFHLGALQRVSAQGGKFRNFLMTSLDRHRRGLWRASQAAKRGGGATVVPLEDGMTLAADAAVCATDLPPDRLHDLALAEALVRVAIERLKRDYGAKGKSALFEALLPIIEGPMAHKTYGALAADLNMSEGSLRVAGVRLLQRFQRSVRQAAGEAWRLPPGPALERELRQLFRAVG